jgi:DNA-binding NarL/FixJ family response regulator
MEFGSHDCKPDAAVAGLLLRYGNAAPHLVLLLRQKYRLTPTQARVATLLADRFTNAEIASELRVQPSTARRHTEAVLLRLGVHRRFDVVVRLAELFAAVEPS